ncbi:uncharacterized protein B0I36DRAFT_359908 [Microdochium trichocladiopsis]|uniref:Copper acquisition factor BIM1-like domain-containing protein n=1 Tax=Microdochium trichocladiopsis TaxID=1682393 RepID=A0A9P8YF67_9PEZI|nr:uncharacterized protein B0I36DRAFT_359908 [Microdochium trichocladiopsis]KAH7038330.1 hypothetical protein B0I36DRAFT_359908 [Microdochium trichocladiopsis]
MAPSLLSAAAAALLLASQAAAHFTVQYPPTIQPFSDDGEDQAPCGGYTPDLASASTVTEFHVGGDSIATKSSHSQQNWLYRITTDNSASSSANWTQIGAITTQSGAGAYCQSKITVPDAWVGKTAILSIVGSAPDGLLYQCSAVKFVAGTAPSTPSQCTTANGVESFGASDPALSALVSNGGGSSSSPTPSGTPSSSTPASSSGTPRPSTTPNAAAPAAAAAGVVGAVVFGVAAMLV